MFIIIQNQASYYNLLKYTTVLNTIQLARNHVFVSNERLTFSDQILLHPKAKSCNRIRQPIISFLDYKTVSTVATFFVYSKLHHCNFTTTSQYLR